MEKAVRALVKFVFIGCYIAFMLASIRHVAVFFNGFEPNGDNMVGSYALAGAFDVTALVTTIGVMFFRKSMPRWVFVIVWLFIGAIALYSYIINWEYTSHFQSMTLLLQPTGQTTPIMDAHGNVHYVAVMQVNTALEFINPFLASGFTIFALIYSVIAEFFGTKPPTATELLAQKQYLEETVGIQTAIDSLKEKTKKPGLIQRGKAKAMELAEARKEIGNVLRKSEEKSDLSLTKKIQKTSEQSIEKQERITGPLTPKSPEEIDQETPVNPSENDGVSHEETGEMTGLSVDDIALVSAYPKALSLFSTSDTTISLQKVATIFDCGIKGLRNRVNGGKIRRTRNKEIVYIDSVILWGKTELLPKGKGKENEGETCRETTGICSQ